MVSAPIPAALECSDMDKALLLPPFAVDVTPCPGPGVCLCDAMVMCLSAAQLKCVRLLVGTMAACSLLCFRLAWVTLKSGVRGFKIVG